MCLSFRLVPRCGGGGGGQVGAALRSGVCHRRLERAKPFNFERLSKSSSGSINNLPICRRSS